MGIETRWLFLSPLPLEGACEWLRKEWQLPPFRFDCEIDSAWGLTERDGVEVNLTQVTLGRKERLEELPHGFPEYNFLLILRIPQVEALAGGSHWFLDQSLTHLSRWIAGLFGVAVHLLLSRWSERPARFLTVRPER